MGGFLHVRCVPSLNRIICSSVCRKTIGWVPKKCFYPWAYPLATSLAFLRRDCVVYMYTSCAGDMAFSCYPDTSFMFSSRQLIFLVQDKVHAAVIWWPHSITMCAVLSYILQTEVFFCYQRLVMRRSLIIDKIDFPENIPWLGGIILWGRGCTMRVTWSFFDYCVHVLCTPTNTPKHEILKINTHLQVFRVKLCSNCMISVSPSLL